MLYPLSYGSLDAIFSLSYWAFRPFFQSLQTSFPGPMSLTPNRPQRAFLGQLKVPALTQQVNCTSPHNRSLLGPQRHGWA